MPVREIAIMLIGTILDIVILKCYGTLKALDFTTIMR